MGTRNLVMLIDQEGQEKVKQYGQWDGYPSGVGVGVLRILRNKELMSKLIKNIDKVRFLDVEGKDKDLVDCYNKNAPKWSSDPDNRTREQIDWFKNYMSRDLSEEVLYNIANSTDKEILLRECKDYDWIEWSYVINLKDNTLSVHSTVDKPAIKVYNLSELPTDEKFISDLDSEE